MNHTGYTLLSEKSDAYCSEMSQSLTIYFQNMMHDGKHLASNTTP